MEPILNMASAPGADVVKDSDTNNFMADVIEASREVPIIVDFWAPWCEPCKQLGPTIEKVVREAKGKVKLVKINVDENQALSQQMRIQSIPAVYAFFQGQPVDGFAGALPESHIKEFVQRLLDLGGDGSDSPVEAVLKQAAEALESGQLGEASALYGQVLGQEPDNVRAVAGMVRAYLAAGDTERARQILDTAPEGADDADLGAARSALELAEQAAGASGNLAELQAKIVADPNDHEARFDLANALHASGDGGGAIDQLLEIVERNRGWNEEAARKQLLKYFEALGPTHELTIDGRRRLSSLLFS
ncbi:MAG: thioredoxin [Alphaproteobacteria bacterium]|nr:thioredoxin [Alphaproteobacteria bacterium]